VFSFLVGLRRSGSLIGAIWVENGEISQNNRKGPYERAHQVLDFGGLVSKLQRNTAQLSRNGVT
jgi:hypothetical protein